MATLEEIFKTSTTDTLKVDDELRRTFLGNLLLETNLNTKTENIRQNIIFVGNFTA